MEDILETTEIATTDIDTPADETDGFGIVLAKSFAVSAATTAGTIGGLLVVGYVVTKIQERKAKKEAAKKEAEQKEAQQIANTEKS